MRQFKIRASAVGTLMTNDKSGKAMGETAKKYVEDWYKSELYGRQKEFSSKYTERGNLSEAEAIDLVADQLGYFVLEKNKSAFEDDFFTGEPDLLPPDRVIDTKCSWDCYTFPLLTNKVDKSYPDQLQVYMHLTGRKKATLAYCLLDLPPALLEAEVKKAMYLPENFGKDEDDIWMQLKEHHTYSNLPVSLRLRTFEYEYSPERIEAIKARVLEARKYLESIKID